MSNQIKLKRGDVANLPTLDVGEPAFTTDTKTLYIGSAIGNIMYRSSEESFTTALKSKLDGVAAGAEVNQNAFSNVLVGGTTIAADGKTDTLEFIAGTSITLTPNATNDSVTIAVTGGTYASSSHTHSGEDVTSAVANATTAASCSGNAATATKLATARNINGVAFDGSADISISASSVPWSGVTGKPSVGDATQDVEVAKELRWKNYGNGHVIFDASAGTSPSGSAVNNTNAAVAWVGTYPVLMGWNGSTTYGVRVDSARVADAAGGVAWSGVSSKPTAITRIADLTTSWGSINISGVTGGYAGINFSDSGKIFMWGSNEQGCHNGTSWVWYIQGGAFTGTAAGAYYGDLAEKYIVSGDVEVGRVVLVSKYPESDCEISNEAGSSRQIGIISENPGFMMNQKLEGGTYVARTGLVDCWVQGPVEKGQVLVSYFNGTAIAYERVKSSMVDMYNTRVATANESIEDNEVKLIKVII